MGIAVEHIASFAAGAAVTIVFIYWSLIRDKRVAFLKEDDVIVSKGYLQRVSLIAQNMMKIRGALPDKEEEFEEISGKD